MNKIVLLLPSKCCRHLLSDTVSQCQYTAVRQYRSMFVKSYTAGAQSGSRPSIWHKHCPDHGIVYRGGLLLNRILSGVHAGSKFSDFFVKGAQPSRNSACQLLHDKLAISQQQSCLYGTSGFTKHIPTLSVKRPARKKTLDDKPELNDKLNVTAYAVAEEIFLQDFQKAIEKQGLYEVQDLPVDVTDALFVRARYEVAAQPREIFFFREGSAIFWNVPGVERREVLKFILKKSTSPYDMELVIQEHEQMGFKYDSSETTLYGDTIMLSETEMDQVQTTLEKYAFSNALSQSVKLAMWEASLEKIADLLEPVTQELRDGLKIRMSRRDVLQRTGELFALRHSINLSSDLLDTPDFYWDRAVLEPLYQKLCNHLNIQRRTKVMNEKLSHCCEPTRLLSSQ
ncbi:required for meiotic nuclear division protein 1 homolog isoform X2 [Gigantopelta aegis]|uniref:required for meiotic nuclear division protein 1 homolog isoform X2 n=1 Tax=Gigantopelta aegis TaxID=1735272 RepID=UPI001B88BCB4|nr:required for meiotic nuclear division protein 1 homolog isoform X2 [Gigantopelta aegis]